MELESGAAISPQPMKRRGEGQLQNRRGLGEWKPMDIIKGLFIPFWISKVKLSHSTKELEEQFTLSPTLILGTSHSSLSPTTNASLLFNDGINLALKKYTCVWGSSSNKSQLGEERKGVGEKGRWPHSDTCCLWDTPASGKQVRDEETPRPTKPRSSASSHHPCTYVSLMTSEKLSICLWGIT